jgi:hypothetical protein
LWVVAGRVQGPREKQKKDSKFKIQDSRFEGKSIGFEDKGLMLDTGC